MKMTIGNTIHVEIVRTIRKVLANSVNNLKVNVWASPETTTQSEINAHRYLKDKPSKLF